MRPIAEIRKEFSEASLEECRRLIQACEGDERKGVRALCKSAAGRLAAHEKEVARTEALKIYEHKYEHLGYVCGIDEVGRGPLAGPVVACAVILPKDSDILYLNDSKKLTAQKREELYGEILSRAVAVGLGEASPERIDEINILQATYEAMRQAVGGLEVQPQILLNDAVTIPGVIIPQVPIIKGDAKSVSIAAASIVAKVTRDRMMEEYDSVYPGYGFASNKGYGTAEHIEALKKLGPSPIHRRSFIGHFVPREETEAGDNKRRTGGYYEEKAAAYLEAQGLKILEKNFQCRQGEIDLIAREGNCLVFVEVKYRKNPGQGDAVAAVDYHKQLKLTRTAEYYLTARVHSTEVPCRFDVVGIDGDEITWMKNAFEAVR